MRSAITVSLVPQAKGGPFVFWNGLADACEQASALGFDAIEIFPPNADTLDLEAIRELLGAHRLGVAAVGTGGGWVVHKWTLTHADAAIRARAKGFIRGIIEKAAALGAPAILGSMQGRWDGDVSREQALAWLAEALDELGNFGGEHGQPFLYEPLNRYETNLIHRTGEAAAWLRQLPTRNVRILSDLFHMNIEETDIADALRAGGDLVGHVHFADSNRHAIGLGHTEVAPIIAALRDINYKGYLSAEILPLPDAATAARRTMESFRQAMAKKHPTPNIQHPPSN